MNCCKKCLPYDIKDEIDECLNDEEEVILEFEEPYDEEEFDEEDFDEEEGIFDFDPDDYDGPYDYEELYNLNLKKECLNFVEDEDEEEDEEEEDEEEEEDNNLNINNNVSNISIKILICKNILENLYQLIENDKLYSIDRTNIIKRQELYSSIINFINIGFKTISEVNIYITEIHKQINDYINKHINIIMNVLKIDIINKKILLKKILLRELWEVIYNYYIIISNNFTNDEYTLPTKMNTLIKQIKQNKII